MHVGDTIFIFCLALIIFGPKKLPEIGRQIGKLMVEFRRASNEFKMQIEEELRASEEAERQKEITAATTMLPTPSASTPALEAATDSASASTLPVITPPTTGETINRNFGSAHSAETFAHEAMPATQVEAKSLSDLDNEFNPALNTASNGAIAEVPVADFASLPSAPASPHPPEESLTDLSATTIRKAEPAVHHG